MEKVKHVVEAGGTMDSILQLTVFLTEIANFDGMNKVFTSISRMAVRRAPPLR